MKVFFAMELGRIGIKISYNLEGQWSIKMKGFIFLRDLGAQVPIYKHVTQMLHIKPFSTQCHSNA